MLVALIALFVALGGSSYAALRITTRNVPKDALTGADIKNLTGRDVRNESLDNRDVRNLTRGDFRAGEFPRDGRDGVNGKDGAPGGLTGLETVSAGGDYITTSGVTNSTGTAPCPAGKKVLGGGVRMEGIGGEGTGYVTTEPSVRRSKPESGPPEGWSASIRAASNEDWYAQVYAICATG